MPFEAKSRAQRLESPFEALRNWVVGLLLLISSAAALVAMAEGAQNDFPPGRIVEAVVSTSDSSQTYALYLPSNYQTRPEWPVLMILDPRGKARRALELFADGAERYGFVVMSSYQTRSGSGNANGPALQAMLVDAGDRFAVDSDRLYLAGMSGTAKVLWRVAPLVKSHLAGIIGCAGALPDGENLDAAPPFDVFLTTGLDDFNYQSIRRLDHRLTALEGNHHLEIFDGDHRWPSQEVATKALAWMNLRAMQRGLKPAQKEWLEDQLAKATADFESLVTTGDQLAAQRALEGIVRDFSEQGDLGEFVARAQQLVDSKAVAAARKREQRFANVEQRQSAAFGNWIEKFVEEQRVSSVPASMAELRVEKLHRQARQTEDAALSHSATRQLELLYVHTFYALPKRLMGMGSLAKAARSVEIATAIDPQRPSAWWKLAEIQTHRGLEDRAFEALRMAASLGNVDIDRLTTDGQWAALRDDPRWAELVEGLRDQGAPHE